MSSSAILRINSERELIDVEPWYQRQGGVWNLEKRQLLIDSILNDYDIPKLYFHVLPRKQQLDEGHEYAIIDGRQRIETIWSFIDDRFPLSSDFEYQADTAIRAAGLTYSDLAKKYPKLKVRFDSFALPIVLVETDDIDLVEDMFSRLNEAVPLRAAEKRNAMGGPMAAAIRNLAGHDFFMSKVKFGNSRYQHREVAARLLFLEYSIETNGKIIDTKKAYLDDMVKKLKGSREAGVRKISSPVNRVVTLMAKIFAPRDDLLRAQSIVTVYFLLFRLAESERLVENLSRHKFVEFQADLQENRRLASEDITEANYDLLEFDRMSQQGTNDGSSIRERVRILADYLDIGIEEVKA